MGRTKSAIYKSINGGKHWEIIAGDMHSYQAYGGDNGMGLPLYDPDGQQQFVESDDEDSPYRAVYQKTGTIEEPLFMKMYPDWNWILSIRTCCMFLKATEETYHFLAQDFTREQLKTVHGHGIN